jgi:hypothetical protein
MSMDSFKARFTDMVGDLRKSGGITITHFWMGPPVDEQDVQAVETKLGYALDAEIKAFFRQTNGLQLRWLKAAPGAATVSTENPGLLTDDDPAEGLVNILPMRRLFIDEDYDDRIYMDWMQGQEQVFSGVTYDLFEFMRSIRPFDNFNTYGSMALVLGTQAANPPAVLGDSHNASFTNSRITDFASYLEAVLRDRGEVSARRTLFKGSDGHEQPPLRGAASLDEVSPWWG